MVNYEPYKGNIDDQAALKAYLAKVDKLIADLRVCYEV